MSDVIRAVRGSWLPMPGRSLDPRVHIPPDVYRFTQNQIESQQRQTQSQVNRTIRAGRLNSQPRAESRPRPININFPSVIFNLPIR